MLRETWVELRGWRLWAIGLLLLVGGFLNDPPWKWYTPDQYFAAYGESFRVVMNLYRGNGFANPFWALPTGPTAHVAPAYPFAQWMLVEAFGEGAHGWLAIRTLATAAQSLQFALLPWVARSFGFSVWTGFLAAVFGIIVKVPREELSESHFAGLAVLLLAQAMTNRRARTAMVAGLVFLAQPVAAAVYFPWALRGPRRWMLALAPVLICVPWLARTYAATGGTGWIRGNLGLELHVSFNDCAPYGIRESERVGCFAQVHPNVNGAEATRVRDMGESEYNREQLRTALAWMTTHPIRTMSLIGQRAWFYWFPSSTGWKGYATQRKRFALLHLLTPLSFIGLWIMWRRRMIHASLLTLWVVLYPAIYCVVQFEERYRYSGLWMTFLLSAFALTRVVSAFPNCCSPSNSLNSPE